MVNILHSDALFQKSWEAEAVDEFTIVQTVLINIGLRDGIYLTVMTEGQPVISCKH